MNLPFADLHIHTRRSDGALSPQELADNARRAGIGTLAITDHNHTEDLTRLRRDNPDLRLIQGAEISCRFADHQGDHEIHVVGLGIDPENEQLRTVLAHNQPDRRPYVQAILDSLRRCGIDLGDYESLTALYPDTLHLGRKQIATLLVSRGFVDTVDNAFDIYIGAFGERRAYVPNPLRYVSMEEAVDAILAAGGIPVLAHLFYYRMDEAGQRALLEDFKALAGDRGAMEVYYARYDDAQREQLRQYADEFGLMYSAASDFHAPGESVTLDNHFHHSLCQPLLDRL